MSLGKEPNRQYVCVCVCVCVWKIYRNKVKDLENWINSILDATEEDDQLPEFKLNYSNCH